MGVRHPALRTAFVPAAGDEAARPRTAAFSPISLAEERPDEGMAHGRAVAAVMDREASTPFDLTRAPLVRAAQVTLPCLFIL